MNQTMINRLRVMAGLLLSAVLLLGCGANAASTAAVDSADSETSTETSADSSAMVDTAQDNGLTITALNVGKADAILFQEDGTNVLMDTGTADGAQDLISSLKNLEVDSIDALILTHYDQDHVGGAAAVLQSFEVSQVLTTYQSKESDEITAYLTAMEQADLTETRIQDTQTFTIGNVSYTIYPPLETSYENDTSNNSSLVTYVTYGDNSFLFCGDIEKEGVKELLNRGGTLDADLIKMPHHGSYEKKLDDLIEAVSPTYAVISTSLDQTEDADTAALLTEAGVTTYRTYNGAVTIHSDGADITVSQ